MAQFRNNYSEILDLARYPGAQWHDSDWGPEGGAYQNSGYYTLGESEGNILRTQVDPWRSVSYRDLKDAGLWDLRDPNGPAWQALKARGYGNIGDIGTKPEATAYAMMDLLGPTATSSDWNAAFQTMDPNLARSVVPAIQGQQIVLRDDANSTTNRVENFAESAILPALASLLLGVPAAGSLFGTGATAAQAGATAGAIGGGTAGIQSGETLADVLKGAAIGGASGGTLGTLKDLIPPSLTPNLPAATQTPQFGEMAPTPAAPVAAPQPTSLAEVLQSLPPSATQGLDWKSATAAAPTGTMTDAMPDVPAPAAPALTDAANVLETPAAGAAPNTVSAPTSLADLATRSLPAASTATPFTPGFGDTLDQSLIGPNAGALPGSGSSFAPPVPTTATGGGSGGNKVSDEQFFDNWDLMNGGADTATPDPTVTYQTPEVMNLPLPGDPSSMPEIAKRILGGGALGPEVRKLLGLPEPASNGGRSIYNMFGAIAPALLGYKASTNQTAAFKDLAEKYMAMGAPSRARFEGSYAPGFTMARDPGYTDALDTSMQSLMRSLSVKGNPYGDPGSLAEAQKYVTANTALPALNTYRNQNAAAGGISTLTAAAPGASSGAINSQFNANAAIGGGIADVFSPQTPQISMADILKLLKGGSGSTSPSLS